MKATIELAAAVRAALRAAEEVRSLAEFVEIAPSEKTFLTLEHSGEIRSMNIRLELLRMIFEEDRTAARQAERDAHKTLEAACKEYLSHGN